MGVPGGTPQNVFAVTPFRLAIRLGDIPAFVYVVGKLQYLFHFRSLHKKPYFDAMYSHALGPLRMRPLGPQPSSPPQLASPPLILLAGVLNCSTCNKHQPADNYMAVFISWFLLV